MFTPFVTFSRVDTHMFMNTCTYSGCKLYNYMCAVAFVCSVGSRLGEYFHPICPHLLTVPSSPRPAMPPSLCKDAARIMAKDLVRTRGYVKKMILMHTQIQAVSLKIQVSPPPALPLLLLKTAPFLSISLSIPVSLFFIILMSVATVLLRRL